MGKESLERLPDEQIEAISGGIENRDEKICSNCGYVLRRGIFEGDGGKIMKFKCPHCGREWSTKITQVN